MPSVLEVYIWEVEAQVKGTIFDQRPRGDRQK
jgi:hypothetical protein